MLPEKHNGSKDNNGRKDNKGHNWRKPSTVISMYRLGRKAYLKHIPVIPGLISRIIRIAYACELPCSCDIGKNCDLPHNGLGVVIHEAAVIGEGTRIYQNVTIGGRNKRGVPVIGKNVFVGCGACILGGVKIGDGARIGANAVVITDIPENATAVGAPAKVVKINSQSDSDIGDD